MDEFTGTKGTLCLYLKLAIIHVFIYQESAVIRTDHVLFIYIEDCQKIATQQPHTGVAGQALYE
jgi:hypothetical protein